MDTVLFQEETIILNLGKYIIENVVIHLIAKLRFKDKTFNMEVPLPNNYPNTRISSSPDVKDKGLFWSEINISENALEKDIAKDYFKVNPTITLILKSFYITSKLENIKPTQDEVSLLSGLGKRVLFLSLPYIIKNLSIAPQAIMLIFKCYGGYIAQDDDDKRIKEYLLLSKDDLLKIFREIYFEALLEDCDYNYMVEYGTKEDMVDEIIALEKNSKLVNYYKLLGFTQLTNLSTSTFMGAMLNTLLNR